MCREYVQDKRMYYFEEFKTRLDYICGRPFVNDNGDLELLVTTVNAYNNNVGIQNHNHLTFDYDSYCDVVYVYEVLDSNETPIMCKDYFQGSLYDAIIKINKVLSSHLIRQ